MINQKVPRGLKSLKSKVDNVVVDKLKPVPSDLSKLIDVVKNDVVKKTVCDELLTKVNAIDTSELVIKTDYDAKIKDTADKISSTTNLATNAVLIAKIDEVKDEIPRISDLATSAALIAVENKIPKVCALVKKLSYVAEISKIEKKYFTTSDYNKLANNILDTKITAKKLVNESGLDEKLKTLPTKEEIKT